MFLCRYFMIMVLCMKWQTLKCILHRFLWIDFQSDDVLTIKFKIWHFPSSTNFVLSVDLDRNCLTWFPNTNYRGKMAKTLAQILFTYMYVAPFQRGNSICGLYTFCGYRKRYEALRGIIGFALCLSWGWNLILIWYDF